MAEQHIWNRLFGMLLATTVAGVQLSAQAAGPPSASPPALEAKTAVPDPKPTARSLRLKHHWTTETLDVVYRIGDDYQPAAMESINRFMRDWRCDRSVAMDPKLIDRIYDLQQAVGERYTIRLISAYRSEGYNASLLMAGRTVDPNSQHMLGRAADVFVPGIHADKLREAAERAGLGGVGYYPFSGPRFIHLDTGPHRHWTEMDPAARRRLGLTGRPRTPFKLDCSLTMAQVLEQVPVIEALAALPPGAAVNAPQSLHNAAFSEPNAGQHTRMDEEVEAAVTAGVPPLCEARIPLQPLNVMPQLVEWRKSLQASVREPALD